MVSRIGGPTGPFFICRVVLSVDQGVLSCQTGRFLSSILVSSCRVGIDRPVGPWRCLPLYYTTFTQQSQAFCKKFFRESVFSASCRCERCLGVRPLRTPSCRVSIRIVRRNIRSMRRRARPAASPPPLYHTYAGMSRDTQEKFYESVFIKKKKKVSPYIIP